jgi:ribose transport system ATP-binding protein
MGYEKRFLTFDLNINDRDGQKTLIKKKFNSDILIIRYNYSTRIYCLLRKIVKGSLNMNTNILEMKNIRKVFPGVVALDNVSFTLQKGEFHAICGENGAGKSTLMKILGGVYIPDEGEIFINGESIRITTPQDSLQHKISIIYQEFNLVPELTITENLFLGKEIRKGLGLDRKQMLHEARKTMARLGQNDINCERLVSACSTATQQLVEIGKAIFNDADILVMDEPTAILSERESQVLFALIEQLIEKGISIIYISHRWKK